MESKTTLSDETVQVTIDLVKIPANFIKKGDRANGDKYATITFYVSARKTPDLYGNTNSVIIKTRNSKEKIYIGNGRLIYKNGSPVNIINSSTFCIEDENKNKEIDLDSPF